MIQLKDVLDRVSTKDGLAYYGVTFDARNFTRCPCHTEKTPSFHYNPKTDQYHCFSCGQSGNVVNFVAESFGFTLPGDLPKVLKKIDQDFQLGLGRPLSAAEKDAYRMEQRIKGQIKTAEASWNAKLVKTYQHWAKVHQVLYQVDVAGSTENLALKELLKRLGHALDDFTGNQLRAWPLSDLTAEQRQWIRSVEKQCRSEQEDERQAQPDFALFLQDREKAGKGIWLGETSNREVAFFNKKDREG